MATSVHQFHQGIRRGDAIGEEMLALRAILRHAGYDSEIFVGEPVPDDLTGEIRPLEEYSEDSDQLLLVHHSVGHHYAGLVSRFADTKVLVYHNITPSRFFVGNPYMQRFLERGRRQLRTLRPHLAGAFADSRYNARELRAAGYLRIEILPPVFALGRLDPSSSPVPSPADHHVLFVGRFATSKRQADVVEAFDAFAARYDRNARLDLVGAAGVADPYAQLVFRRIERSPFADRIATPGVVSDRELARLFRQATIYLSMSEHEGFGVPLLESFRAGVPVIAFDGGAVAETMGGAGVVFSRKDVDEVAALMAEVAFDPALRQRIIEGQFRRLEEPDISRAEERFLESIERWLDGRRGRQSIPAGRPSLKIRVDGPFETSYGLAVANRRLAEALSDHTAHRVSIHCTEGPGDYLPRARDLDDKPFAGKLWTNSFSTVHPDVVIRNTYPPRFSRSSARLHLAYFFWEDSRIPPGWAEGFNSSYDGVLAPTRYVRDLLRNSGVTIPIEVVPTVVEIEAKGTEPTEPIFSTTKSTRFLCVGSAFPRKGVDVLLRAFVRAFRRTDDVCLVVKSFPNVHNTVAAQLEEIRRKDPEAPEIHHIDRDVSAEALLALYRSCHALVQPSRSEGFGLPVAEAMLLGLPVIAPSATGLADFCRPDTALVLPHRWEASTSHLASRGAQWAEPDEDALTRILQGFANGTLREEAERRAKTARQFVIEHFSPRAVAHAADAALESIERQRHRPVSIAFASTWNSRCGIASYTKSLIDALPPEETRTAVFGNVDFTALGSEGPEVQRVWVQGSGNYVGLVNEALERALDTVHIQFHPALFTDYRELSRVINGLCDRGVRVFVTVHLAAEEIFFYNRRMTLEDLAAALSRCERIFVHGERDVERLSRLGLGSKVRVMSHGGIVFPQRDRTTVARELGFGDRPVFATFGYAFSHKGVLEAIEATSLLRERFPEILFLSLSARRDEGGSGEYLDLCRRRISELSLEQSVVLFEDFLSEAEVGVLLSAAHVIVLPYGRTLESASGAVRYPLACGRATITTREGIFDDVRDVAYRIPDCSPETIARAVAQVLSDDELREHLERRASRFALETSWPRIARRHLDAYREVLHVHESVGAGLVGVS